MNHEQAIEEYTELMRRVSVGADEERSASHDETSTSPEDGVEEALANLERLAAKEGLQFVWRERSQRYALEPLPMDAHDDDQTGTPHTRFLAEEQRRKDVKARRKARSVEKDEGEDSQPQEEEE